jgi:peptidyl-prolyl cis-trans isomerase B (cyclophilin B)
VSTEKRERQKTNRARRLAEAEEILARRRNRSRVITYGSIAVAIIVAVIIAAQLTKNDGSPEPAAEPAAQPELPAADEDSVVGDSSFVYGSGECPAPDGSDGPVLDFTGPQPLCIDPARDHVAVFDTSEGEIRVDLDTESVPGTVNNFVTLSRWGYYDDTLLFRTDPSIAIIQGGSPHTNSASDPGPGYTISDEPPFTENPDGSVIGPYRYEPGQIVMARGPGTDSASAQFFFTTGTEASRLDGQGSYVVFGTTDEAGLAVLQSIIGLHVPGGTLGGAPSRDVTVNSVTIQEI